MSKKITLVTAFFDIGRKDFEDIPRSNEKYVEHFKFWARMKNDLVVYTDSIMAENVKKIRKEFGLLDKTKIIIIDDITKIEPEIYNKMKLIENDPKYLAFRYKANATENNALYNYVMMLKSWFIKDVVDKKYAEGLVAWLDFGFNHGGDVYTDPKDFDYEWKYDFPDKITYFSLKEDLTEPIFSLVQSFDSLIMGAPFVMPDKLANEHYNLIREATISLLDCGFIDDDQLLMIMAYRKKPEIFNIVRSDWFMPLYEFGGSHLKVKEKVTKVSFKDRVLRRYRIDKRNRMYLKRFKKEFLKKNLG